MPPVVMHSSAFAGGGSCANSAELNVPPTSAATKDAFKIIILIVFTPILYSHCVFSEQLFLTCKTIQLPRMG
ncbi:MAG: hypothetical protein ACI9C4_000830 [Paraglaciecola sp.]|jgi:hypothetical protein